MVKAKVTNFRVCIVCGKEPAPVETGLGKECAKKARPDLPAIGQVLIFLAGFCTAARAVVAAAFLSVMVGCKPPFCDDGNGHVYGKWHDRGRRDGLTRSPILQRECEKCGWQISRR